MTFLSLKIYSFVNYAFDDVADLSISASMVVYIKPSHKSIYFHIVIDIKLSYKKNLFSFSSIVYIVDIIVIILFTKINSPSFYDISNNF